MSGISAGRLGGPLRGEAGDHRIDLALASGPRIGRAQRRLQVIHPRARHMGIDDARPQRVGGLQTVAGQREEHAERARQRVRK